MSLLLMFRPLGGTTTYSGTGSPSLPLITASGAAKLARKGADGSPVLPLITAAGTGKIIRKGTGTPTLPLITASGAGKLARKGTGTPVLPLITADGDGDVIPLSPIYRGTGDPILPLITAEGVGKIIRKGTGDPVLPLITASGAGTSTGAPVTPTPPGSGPGGGGRIYYQGRRRKRTLEEQPLKHLEHILDTAIREYYEDILESDATRAEKAEAGRIVKPFTEKRDAKLRLTPDPDAVDWTALKADVIQARKLLELWIEAVREREISDDDDEMMLLH